MAEIDNYSKPQKQVRNVGWNKDKWLPVWNSLNGIKRSSYFAGAWGKARTLMSLLQQGHISSTHNTELFLMRNELIDLAHELHSLIQTVNDTIGDWGSQ